VYIATFLRITDRSNNHLDVRYDVLAYECIWVLLYQRAKLTLICITYIHTNHDNFADLASHTQIICKE